MARAWILASSLLTACSSSPASPPLDVPDGCNPIAAMPGQSSDCLLPYPSDFFRTGSGASARVVLPQNAQIADKVGNPIDLFALHPPRGFSAGNQILALFPEGIDDGNLVGAASDLTQSLTDASPTVLIDGKGHRVLHLAEVDPRALDDTRRALLIRPLARLQYGQRTIVAIRRLRDKSGAPLPPREGFRRLRDGDAAGDPSLAALAARYEQDVFAPLTAAGVARGELQLAWDFTVRPLAEVDGDMLAVRAQTIDYFKNHAPKLAVLSQADNPVPHIARKIELTIEVPLFLTATDPMSPLHRDGSGQVAQNGTTEVPFSVWIPNSVAALAKNAPPARLLQYGHGFFGNRTEVDTPNPPYLTQFADQFGFVVVASDWWGMSSADVGPVAAAIGKDPSTAAGFTDRVHQAMANAVSISLAEQALSAVPALQLGPTPPFEPTAIYYHGNSLGGILGTTYCALSPRVDHAGLGVGGVDFSLMMFRATPFLGFLALIQIGLPDALDQQKFGALLQSELDRIDPTNYLDSLRAPLGGTPNKRQVLMQIGINDDEVPNLASHMEARSLGIGLLQPSTRAIALVPPVMAPQDDALVEFDFGASLSPLARPATAENGVHEGVRRTPAAQQMLDQFLRKAGVVEQTCGGPCKGMPVQTN